ncbi:MULTISPECIES: TetR/AcrR family transcriptional regulator [unclassified Embleya]|uniref:TetR/AcrR family transcriptional regulator n=1 Tax=unclassified Embleya TaxID=2699296 RepID=UPI0033DD9D29
MPSDHPRRGRAARHAPQPADTAPTPSRKAPITLDRITDAALHVIATEGYDALTVRRITHVLGTGPSSLYAHIVNRDDIDDLIIGRLCSEIVLPEPDPANWQAQTRDVCGQLRDRFLAYPGVSRAALAMLPTNLETLRVNEGLLAILLAGGVDPQRAAWAIDSLSLYVSAYALERSLLAQRRKHPDHEWVFSRAELVGRFEALPADRFPQIRRHAAELTSGAGHDRFDFALGLIIDNLVPEHPSTRPDRVG